nr:hypothetical protein [Tanacetum cinerariifolium]
MLYDNSSPRPPEEFVSANFDAANFQNSSEPSNASTNIVKAPREPYVVKQDNGSFVDNVIFKAPDSPNQFYCFHCKDVLRAGEACKRCTCKSCGKDAHIGYNCPSKVPIISNPEPCNNQTIDELPQALPMNDAYYGHYCTPQAPFIYMEPCYNQDFNFPQDSQNVPQQYPCCDDCGVTHDTYQCQPMNEVYSYGQNSCYDSTSIGFDQSQPQQYTVDHPIFNAHNDYLDFQIQLNRLPPFSAITLDDPVLSTEEPDHSLSMGDEHLDTTPAMKSDEFIKSGVENLIPIPSESEGIPEHVCDVPSHDNSPPLDVSKDQIEDFSGSNKEVSSIDDDSFSIDDIDYVEASPPDSKLFNSEVMKIVIPEVGGIDDDILLTIEHDVFREKLLNVNLLIAKIEALNANPTSSSDCKSKSSSTSLTSFLKETNTFDNSLPEFETFCFNVEEISSGSTTTPPDISLLEYEAFHDDHVKEISSGSPITHSDSSLYASFMFDLSINPFPPADRSDSYEFTDELIPFISAPEYDYFLFKVEPNLRDFNKDVVENISPMKEPQVLNALPTHPTLQLNMKFQPSSESLFAYVVWIFLPFLVYSVAPRYLFSLRNEDAIFDPGIC